MCLLPYFSPAQAQQSSKSAKSQKKESYTMRGVVSDSQGVLPGATVYLQNKDQRIIVGAVTHVFTNDPTMGYGVYADWQR